VAADEVEMSADTGAGDKVSVGCPGCERQVGDADPRVLTDHTRSVPATQANLASQSGKLEDRDRVDLGTKDIARVYLRLEKSGIAKGRVEDVGVRCSQEERPDGGGEYRQDCDGQ
jgi:hypothetical protein